MDDTPVSKPGGDKQEDNDTVLLDNLTEHLNMLGISGTDAEAAKKNYSRRKLTTDEHNELRKTTLVKKRTASKA